MLRKVSIRTISGEGIVKLGNSANRTISHTGCCIQSTGTALTMDTDCAYTNTVRSHITVHYNVGLKCKLNSIHTTVDCISKVFFFSNIQYFFHT